MSDERELMECPPTIDQDVDRVLICLLLKWHKR